MHAREGAPVILRPIQGHPWVRLAAGSTMVLPVAGDLIADEICSSEVPSLSVTLTSGVVGPLSVAGGTELGVDPGVFSVFHPIFELVFRK